MIKTIELVIVAILLIFSFFAGVKYSDSVKNHASWLFETKDEEEVALPDLSNESGVEITAPSEENPENFNGAAEANAPHEAVPPMDNIETNHNPASLQTAPANPARP